MSNYDLQKLNDKEFESLAADVIATCHGRRVERFRPGRDSGVDGRYFVAGNAEAILQAKHWARSGFDALLRHLTDVERGKVERLQPARYVLVTSVALSRVNKRAIVGALSPHLRADDDVWGEQDIQDFLASNPELVKRHPKLWLASAEVLRLVLNAAIVGRSQFKTQEIYAFLPKYVITGRHQGALEKLEQRGTIIITGDPGVGKTTLADHVALDLILNGYEVCVVENSLNEVEAVWAAGRKQLFYFDDFLGRNYLAALNRHEDSHVIGFMKRVEADHSKRFILTSRTTILQQGRDLSDLFRACNIDRAEYEIKVEDLSAMEKARILYNHIWFGDLSPAHVDELYVDKRYRRIIGHRNFNPRLIAFITDPHKIAGVPPSEYWNYITAMLDNPAEIWRGVFENQLDQIGRTMVTLTVFNGGTLNEELLRLSCERLTGRTATNATEWGLAYERSYRTCVGTMLNREKTGQCVQVTLFNPSVGDFLLHTFAHDGAIIGEVLGALQSSSSLRHLQAIQQHAKMPQASYGAVLVFLARKHWAEFSGNTDFEAILTGLVIGHAPTAQSLQAELRELSQRWFELATNTIHHADVAAVVTYFLGRGWVSKNDPQLLEWVRAVIDHSGLDEDLVPVSGVILLMEETIADTAAAELGAAVIAQMKETIDDSIRDDAILADYDDPERHFERAVGKVTRYVKERLADYALVFDAREVGEIVEACDIASLLEANRENDSDEDDSSYYGQRDGGGDDDAAIDDWFERGN